MIRLKNFILLLLACAPISVAAQDDFGGNISVELSKKLNKRLDVSLEEEVRLTHNWSHFDRSATTLAADVKLVKKYLKAGIAYSVLAGNESTYFMLDQRAVASLTGYVSAGNFAFSLKGRYQATFLDERFRNARKINPKQIVRGKAEVEYGIQKIKLSPYFSAEAYYDVSKKNVNRFKYSLGAKKKVNKHNSFGVGLQIDDKLKSNNYYILLGYSYKL